MSRNTAFVSRLLGVLALMAFVVLLGHSLSALAAKPSDQTQLPPLDILTHNYMVGDTLLLTNKPCLKKTTPAIADFIRAMANKANCPGCTSSFRYAEEYTYETGKRMTTFPTCWLANSTGGVMVIQDTGVQLLHWQVTEPLRRIK